MPALNHACTSGAACEMSIAGGVDAREHARHVQRIHDSGLPMQNVRHVFEWTEVALELLAVAVIVAAVVVAALPRVARPPGAVASIAVILRR